MSGHFDTFTELRRQLSAQAKHKLESVHFDNSCDDGNLIGYYVPNDFHYTVIVEAVRNKTGLVLLENRDIIDLVKPGDVQAIHAFVTRVDEFVAKQVAEVHATFM